MNNQVLPHTSRSHTSDEEAREHSPNLCSLVSPRNMSLSPILTSYLCVTSSRTNRNLYGDTIRSIIGSDTPRSDPHRKRVTGGIFMISSTNDMLKA